MLLALVLILAETPRFSSICLLCYLFISILFPLYFSQNFIVQFKSCATRYRPLDSDSTDVSLWTRF